MASARVAATTKVIPVSLWPTSAARTRRDGCCRAGERVAGALCRPQHERDHSDTGLRLAPPLRRTSVTTCAFNRTRARGRPSSPARATSDYRTCGRPRERRPRPPTMTSVDTTTRNGMGVSSIACPVAAIMTATPAPNASGSSKAHRLGMITPAARATAKIRMMVMGRRMPPTLSRVQCGSFSEMRPRAPPHRSHPKAPASSRTRHPDGPGRVQRTEGWPGTTATPTARARRRGNNSRKPG